MQTYAEKIYSLESHKEVLVIGNTANAFTSNVREGELFDHCENGLEAIALTAQKHFATIYIVLSGIKAPLGSVVSSLRRTSPDAKIILLAQMHEEPTAAELIRSPQNAADDYYICPAGNNVLLQQAVETKKSKEHLFISDYKKARIRELEKLATEDDLTGLKNRRYVRSFLKQVLKRAESEDIRITLLLFDIDNFKHYNDAFGHPVGDNVLKQAAIIMKRCCRKHDIVGRIGGDEFAVVFWDCPHGKKVSGRGQVEDSERRKAMIEHPRQVFAISERFRKVISSANLPFLGADGKGTLTISGGLASFPNDGTAVSELFAAADKAMFEAKRSGKNQIYLVGKPI